MYARSMSRKIGCSHHLFGAIQEIEQLLETTNELFRPWSWHDYLTSGPVWDCGRPLFEI